MVRQSQRVAILPAMEGRGGLTVEFSPGIGVIRGWIFGILYRSDRGLIQNRRRRCRLERLAKIVQRPIIAISIVAAVPPREPEAGADGENRVIAESVVSPPIPAVPPPIVVIPPVVIVVPRVV